MPEEKEDEKSFTSENFQKALDFINSNNEEDFYALVRSGLNLTEVDSHGTSIIQHAAFRGRSKMVDFLIKNGSDVNETKHEHNYFTLHFAALSADVDTVSVLLAAGAKTDVENKVKRTAAEMAAFTGQSHIASYINSYFSPKVFLRYTDESVGQSLHCDSKLASDLHKMATNYNIHPVRLTMFAKNNTYVLKNVQVSTAILDCERDSQFKKENNEVLSLRLHFVSCLLRRVHIEFTNQKSKSENEQGVTWESCCDSVVKWFLKPEKESNVKEKTMREDNLDRFIKAGLKEYPFRQSQLLQQAVKTISNAMSSGGGEGEEITSYPISVYLQVLTGSQAPIFMAESHCVSCREKLKNHLRCSRCKQVQYCDKWCQSMHWAAHKKECKAS